MSIVFEEFPKIPRLKRDCVITEKIDGTNASIHISECQPDDVDDEVVLRLLPNAEGAAFSIRAGSRTRWITPGKDTDNFGFAQWVSDHGEELVKLGPGHHFGEWYGAGIQRRYDLNERRFALFNTARWNDQNPNRPACCGVVPVLYQGALGAADEVMEKLRISGSIAVPGFMQPEGVVVYHSASRQLFKALLDNDDVPKSKLPRVEKTRDFNTGGRRKGTVEGYVGPYRRSTDSQLVPALAA